MRKERIDILESMNVIVAERLPYVDRFMQVNQLNEECRKHIFPVFTPDPRYIPFVLLKVGGAFAFLLLFLCVSIVVFLIEIISKSRMTTVTLEAVDTIVELHSYYDANLTINERDAISMLHLEMQQLIAHFYMTYDEI
jgi:hypothetical protein